VATTNDNHAAAGDDDLEAFLAAKKAEEEKQAVQSRNPSMPVREPAASMYKKKEPEPPKIAAPILAPLPSKTATKAPAKRRAADSSDENESSGGSDSEEDTKPIRAPPPKIGGGMPLPSLSGAPKALPNLAAAAKPSIKKPAFADSDEDDDASDWKPAAKIVSKAPAKKAMAFFDDDDSD